MEVQNKAVEATRLSIQALTDRQLSVVTLLCEDIMEGNDDESALKNMSAIEELIGSTGDETIGFHIPF